MGLEKFGGSTEKKGGEPENPGRRGFLKSVIGGMVVGGLGVAGLELSKNESEINTLREHFGGNSENPSLANEAAAMLLEEMNAQNIDSIKLTSGPGLGGRVDILRDFLTQHLNSKVGSTYTFRDAIIRSGEYTRENLVEILSATTLKLEQQTGG